MDEFRSGDLRLRPFRDDDVTAIAHACADPETARFIPLIPTPYTEDHARAYVAFTRELGDRDRRPFAIADAETDELLGAIDVRLGEIGSIGYWVVPWARGRGVATTALSLLARWALEAGGVRRLELVTHPDNVASQRVAEKAGFTREGSRPHDPPFRDGTRESVLFARSRTEPVRQPVGSRASRDRVRGGSPPDRPPAGA